MSYIKQYTAFYINYIILLSNSKMLATKMVANQYKKRNNNVFENKLWFKVS